MIKTNVIKLLILCAISALISVGWTPALIHFLYKYKLWRKKARKIAIDGKPAEVFYKLHKTKEVGTPRLGGLLIWITCVFVAFLFAFLSNVSDNFWLQKLNFLSRDQTWLPLATLVAASFLGLCDDILQIFGKGEYKAGGLRFTRRLVIVLLIGTVGAWWFYVKLGWHSIYVPFVGDIEIGFLYIPLFVITVLACWAGGVVDGIDGLAGGTFAILFTAFTILAYARSQYNLASFCAVLVGTIFAFLWFNIPPARFYMGESGTIGLTSTLAVVAFLTDSVTVLPIIGGVLVIEAGSVILQLLAKKILKKKIFICAPLHHHLEAKGWSREKITMRFWILGMIFAIFGVIIRLAS